jgi:predicted MFS family arabinose efflux permease
MARVRGESEVGRYALYALAVLCAINLLNYIDRQVMFAVFEPVKRALGFSDARLGVLGSAFIWVYLLAAPFVGPLADRFPRRDIIAIALVLWSAATAGAGLATGFWTLFLARALVGIGEAAYATVSPTLIADYFPPERRSTVLSVFFMATPVGSALGYILGGWIGETWGWRAAFFLVGLPGLALAALVWRLREPTACGRTPRPLSPSEALGAYGALLRNRSYLLNALTMAAMTFALGGLAAWFPTYLIREAGMGVGAANQMFGAVTVAAGVAGTLAGGWIGDRLQRRTRKAYLLLSGIGLLLGVPASLLAILQVAHPAAPVFIFVAEWFLFLNTGPLNAVIVNVTRPAVRPRAFALNIFLIHFLGDAVSPAILGAVSDTAGLRTALLLAPVMLALAGALCLAGVRGIERDMDAAAEP